MTSKEGVAQSRMMAHPSTKYEILLCMSAKLVLENGVSMRHGEHYDFADYHPLQRALLPVVSTVAPERSDEGQTFRIGGRTLYGLGTAVCIGAGWFLTAKHVVEHFAEAYDHTQDELLFVVLETDTLLSPTGSDVFGGMLQVRAYDMHPDADIASLTAELPVSGVPELRSLGLSLRMPSPGEPVAALGYPIMRASGSLPDTGTASIEWERTLRASVGVVTEQVPDRLGGWYRPGPGFVTDTPAFSGMSGGPVLDASNAVIGFVSSSMPPSEGSGWTSYVALLGPALELDVLDMNVGQHADSIALPSRRIARLLKEGAIQCDIYDSCSVNPLTGLVEYVST